MQPSGVIVIGGGAAGLMAAYTLSKAGIPVTLLEARDRLGGRIHTIQGSGFAQPVEAGAEFVHGHLPLTLQLLKEAGTGREETGGGIWRAQDGRLTREDDFIEQSGLLTKHLDELREDITIADFLDRFFSAPQHEKLRNSIRGFAEGYDAADIHRASAFALREEWAGEDDQYRPAGGYGSMIGFLEKCCRRQGCTIALSSVVEKVAWQPGQVRVCTNDGQLYTAARLLATLPLSLLQLAPPAPGAVRFSPELPEKRAAARRMGMGHVIKILLEFKEAFWKETVKRSTGADLSKAAWIFSSEQVPTWWTQYPHSSNLLTGWLAGPNAAARAGMKDQAILQLATGSLANIFSLPVAAVQSALVHAEVFNWSADLFSQGAYAYNTVETLEARKTILQPEADTLYFAGEALYEGPEMGTVEGALSSGKKVAERLLAGNENKKAAGNPAASV